MTQLTAKDVMNPNVLSVPADWTIEELGQFLIDKAITGAPVTDERGTFIGVVSLTDIVRQESMAELRVRADDSAPLPKPNKEADSAPYQKPTEAERGRRPHDYYLHGWENRLAPEDISSFHIEDKPQITVREIMTPMIFKVDEKTSIKEIADTMIDGRIHRLLVTRDGKIIGIVTTMDLLRVVRDL
jgi:CBS domain-containing protein